MFDPAVVFEENKLSDTVVEFKIAKAEILHPIYVLVLTILMSFTVWGLWVSKSNLYPPLQLSDIVSLYRPSWCSCKPSASLRLPQW
jgi:hypothetical protein